MRRVRLSIASVVLACVLAVVMNVTGAAGTTYAAGTALSVLADGVLVSHGGGPFVAAVDGESLHEGDTIRSGGGRAIVTYFEGSSVTIEPDTEIAIDATETAPDGGTIVLMTQLVGRTWNVVTKLITGGSRYEIRTPTTTASVRGTKFEVDANAVATTVTTSEGLVVQRVPVTGGLIVDVPVRAGMTQTQRRGVPPAPATSRPAAATADAAAFYGIAHAPGLASRAARESPADTRTRAAQVLREDEARLITQSGRAVENAGPPHGPARPRAPSPQEVGAPCRRQR